MAARAPSGEFSLKITSNMFTPGPANSVLVQANYEGTATGFGPYSLLDPAVVGDLAGDAVVDGGDVAYLKSFILNLPRTKIPKPPGLTGIVSPSAPDPTRTKSETSTGEVPSRHQHMCCPFARPFSPCLAPPGSRARWRGDLQHRRRRAPVRRLPQPESGCGAGASRPISLRVGVPAL